MSIDRSLGTAADGGSENNDLPSVGIAGVHQHDAGPVKGGAYCRLPDGASAGRTLRQKLVRVATWGFAPGALMIVLAFGLSSDPQSAKALQIDVRPREPVPALKAVERGTAAYGSAGANIAGAKQTRGMQTPERSTPASDPADLATDHRLDMPAEKIEPK